MNIMQWNYYAYFTLLFRAQCDTTCLPVAHSRKWSGVEAIEGKVSFGLWTRSINTSLKNKKLRRSKLLPLERSRVQGRETRRPKLAERRRRVRRYLSLH